jgi:hypothetical protein
MGKHKCVILESAEETIKYEKRTHVMSGGTRNVNGHLKRK